MKKPIEFKQNDWGDISGIKQPQTIRQFKGINTLDQFSIEEDFMTMNKNISTKRFPTASVREGSSPLGVVAGIITGLMIWKDREIHAVSNGEWKRWLGASWESLASGLSTTKKWSFTNFKGNFTDIGLIAANGVDPVKVYNGTTVTNLANAPVGMNYVVGHENRLYGAVKNALHYSALRLPTDWNTVDQSGSLVIENNSGEEIASVIAGTGRIVVFMPHSMHELYGTGPINYRLQLVSDSIGCVNHQSVVTLGGVVYFLSHDGLYRYGGGAVPNKDFSLVVQTLFDRINVRTYDKVSAGTDGERYYISFAMDSAVEPNITIEYDPKFDIWNVWEFSKTPTVYANAEDVMYIGTKEDALLRMNGTLDSDQAIPFELRTKPFTSSSMANKNRLYRLWVVADVPLGATLNISLSNDDDGITWTQVRTIIGETNMMGLQIEIPVNQSFYNRWVRIKLDGVGAVTIHEITRQERTFRMGIGGI
jgi:hypothetical protein